MPPAPERGLRALVPQILAASVRSAAAAEVAARALDRLAPEQEIPT